MQSSLKIFCIFHTFYHTGCIAKTAYDFFSGGEAEEEAIRRRAGRESKLYLQVEESEPRNKMVFLAGKTSGLTFQLPWQLLYHGFVDASYHTANPSLR